MKSFLVNEIPTIVSSQFIQVIYTHRRSVQVAYGQFDQYSILMPSKKYLFQLVSIFRVFEHICFSVNVFFTCLFVCCRPDNFV